MPIEIQQRLTWIVEQSMKHVSMYLADKQPENKTPKKANAALEIQKYVTEPSRETNPIVHTKIQAREDSRSPYEDDKPEPRD